MKTVVGAMIALSVLFSVIPANAAPKISGDYVEVRSCQVYT